MTDVEIREHLSNSSVPRDKAVSNDQRQMADESQAGIWKS
jgi:hypothetical protein